MRLDGRTALITGSTQGVGAAIAKRLAAAGCNLVLHGLVHDSYAEDTVRACRALGAEVDLRTADLSGSMPDCLQPLLAGLELERIPLLVNNAGTFCDRPFLEMDVDLFDRTFQLNVAAGYFLTQAFARTWVQRSVRGRVLFTGSINGQLSEPGHTAYDASKGAVQAMVRSLCVSLAPHGIRVNAMAPGLVVTPLTAPSVELDEDVNHWMRLHTPSGQVPGPEVCGGAALYLLSDEAEHVHGQTLTVDGGMSAWQQPDLPPQLRGRLRSGSEP